MLAGGWPFRSIWGLAPMVRPRGSCNRETAVSLRCLIIDDNASFREEMCGLLEDQGISVVGGAASGTEARHQIAGLQPDVILVDVNLGEESGFELVRRLCDASSPGEVQNMILISTHDPGDYADLIEASPALGFLPKTDLSAPAIVRMLHETDASGPKPSDERRGT